jgi:hypothetical protein
MTTPLIAASTASTRKRKPQFPQTKNLRPRTTHCYIIGRGRWYTHQEGNTEADSYYPPPIMCSSPGPSPVRPRAEFDGEKTKRQGGVRGREPGEAAGHTRSAGRPPARAPAWKTAATLDATSPKPLTKTTIGYNLPCFKYLNVKIRRFQM